MTHVVMKFGGTSVGDTSRLRAVARHIAHRRRDGTGIVAVVSAMGSTTDELLARAAELSERPPPRELDLLLATGECAAANLLCIALAELGVSTHSFTGGAAGILTSGTFGRARIVDVDTTALTRALDARQVAVVAGFQGARSDGEATTLGRGGSDTSAVAIAAALGVSCEIYSDVPAVLAADPRVVPDAAPRWVLSHEAMASMSAHGSKVVARRAVDLAAARDVALHIRSSWTWQPGTLVSSGSATLETPTVLAVSHNSSAVLVMVQGVRGDAATLAQLLAALGSAHIDVHLVPRTTFSATSVIEFIVGAGDHGAATEILEPLVRRRGGRLVPRTDVALVSIVGTGLISYAEIAGTAVAAVGRRCPTAELLIASATVITWLVPAVVANDVVRDLCGVLNLRTSATACAPDAVAG